MEQACPEFCVKVPLAALLQNGTEAGPTSNKSSTTDTRGRFPDAGSGASVLANLHYTTNPHFALRGRQCRGELNALGDERCNLRGAEPACVDVSVVRKNALKGSPQNSEKIVR